MTVGSARHSVRLVEGRGKEALVDQRFEVPLYTVAEAARHLDIAPSTIRYWIDEKRIIR